MELKPGYKQTEVGVVPEDWGVVPLGKLYKFSNGVNADKAAYGKGLRFINVLEPITYSHIRGPEISGLVELPSQVAAAYTVKSGDIVFNRTSETDSELGMAAVYLGDEKVVFGGFVIRGQAISHVLDPVYAGYALRGEMVRTQIIPLGQGAVRANIGQESLRKVLVLVPPENEQRLIAEALQDIDCLLSNIKDSLCRKRQIKQAAMQELLTGKRRLPGFEGEWEVKRLGEVLKFQVGCPFSSAFFNEKEQGLRLVKNRDLKSDDQVFHYSGRYDPAFQVSDGDVLVGMDGDFLPCRWAKGAALLNQRVGRIVPLSGLNRSFAFYYLIGPLKEIEVATGSTTVKHLSHGNIEGIEKPLPSVPEQTAIADVLTEMDAELALLEKRREQTLDLKQGMMQQLLTGKIRLT
jgi:type I restriction enzyme, S subunit